MKYHAQIFYQSFLTLFCLSVLPQSAFAFDCAKATTKTELAICANEDLLSADENMELAYFSLLRQMDKVQKKQTRQSQRNWLKYRNSYCEAEPGCLNDEIESRRLILEKITNFQPSMAPVFIWRQGNNTSYTVLFEAMNFSNPISEGQKAFNLEIERLISEAPLHDKKEEISIGSYENETRIDVTRLTPYMISAFAYIYDYSGGAHPNSWSSAINVDLKSGKVLEASHLFSRAALDELTQLCRDQIIEAKSEYYDGTLEQSRAQIEEEYPGEVSKHIANFARWSFAKENTTVHFDAYAIGSYAEGPFECEFTSEQLVQRSHNPALFSN